jgi:mercuric ion transport protein
MLHLIGRLASACCVGSLVLFALGVSGAWISSLTLLEPYRPIFVGLTLLFLAFAFHRLYVAPRVCTPGSACANPRTLSRRRLAFWIVTVLLIAVPCFAPPVLFTTLETVTLDVKNMACPACPITVKKALEKLPGVTNATVDFEKKTAGVTFDPDKASPATLTKATSDAEYPSTVHN